MSGNGKKREGAILREAAADYAQQGLSVFPLHHVATSACSCGKSGCTSPAKHPRTKKGLKNATVEQGKIDWWWRRWQLANIGIRTGAVSGIVVIDIDPRHGGNKSLDALTAEYGQLPVTVESKTGDGTHFAFQHPGVKIRNRTNFRPGIDVRGDGGYIVAPPSMHINGRRYAWVSGQAPGEVDLAPLPEWLLELLVSPVSVGETERTTATAADENTALLDAAARYVAKADAVAEGQRNNMAFNLAGHLAAFQTESGLRLHESQIVGLLRQWNQQNDPPLADAELERTVQSALKNGTPRAPHIVKTGAVIGAVSQAAVTTDALKLPVAVLPGGPQRVTDSAEQLGELLAARDEYFTRGGVICKLIKDVHGARRLQPLKPAAMPALLEQVARLARAKLTEDGIEYDPTVCSEYSAKILLHSEPFQRFFPPIHVLARCPVLIERDGKLIQVVDYDRQSGIMAEGEPAPEITLDEARELLHGLMFDFQFPSVNDRARALAALITPALVLGRLLRGRAPVDLAEADQSQAGKGYRNKLTAAIYRETIKTVTQRRGGVGSLEETFNAALISGAPFIALDNIRGKIDSPAIESFLTEDVYHARIPYAVPAEIDPKRTIVMITSNKAEVTPDLANRSSCVRVLKQPIGYMFQEFSEGDLLDHVKANQPLYLGAVFAVIREWHRAGKPTTKESRHDFRRWARVLDWIVQKLLLGAPIMVGHRQTQQRMTNPSLTWLRELALAVQRSNKLDQWLRAHNLLDVLEDTGMEVPGIGEDDDVEIESAREKALRGVGKRLAKCFGPGTGELQMDHLCVERHETLDDEERPRKEYRFRKTNSPNCPVNDPALRITPHTPRESGTFSARVSDDHMDHMTHPSCMRPVSKESEPRGVCGAMRGRGVEDEANRLFEEAFWVDGENTWDGGSVII